MRRSLLAAVVVIAVGTGCGSKRMSDTYDYNATKACLGRDGGTALSAETPLPDTPASFKDIRAYTSATGSVDVMFAPTASGAARWVQRVRPQYGRQFSQLVYVRKNAIIVWPYAGPPDRQARAAVERCLR